MPHAQLFRRILIAAEIFGLMSLFLDIFIPDMVPADLREARALYFTSVQHTSMEFALELLLLAVLLIGGLISTVGMYLYKPWGRRYSLWLSLLAMLAAPFQGPIVRAAWPNAFAEAGMLLWGATLTMAYFSDACHLFESADQPAP